MFILLLSSVFLLFSPFLLLVYLFQGERKGFFLFVKQNFGYSADPFVIETKPPYGKIRSDEFEIEPLD